MIQEILILFLFVAAAFYCGRTAYKSFFAKETCASGCGKCSAVDFSKIEKQLKEKGL